MAISKWVLALGAALISSSAAQAADTPVLTKAKDLDALVAKMANGLASAQIPSGSPKAVVMLARRDADGQVEVHTHLADETIVRTGHARIRVGGTVTGQKQTAPGEFRGGTLTGGQVFDLAPGDALYIPAGVPHQMLVSKGSQIVYTTAKFAQ